MLKFIQTLNHVTTNFPFSTLKIKKLNFAHPSPYLRDFTRKFGIILITKIEMEPHTLVFLFIISNLKNSLLLYTQRNSIGEGERK